MPAEPFATRTYEYFLAERKSDATLALTAHTAGTGMQRELHGLIHWLKREGARGD
jgi:hypothetical protein